MKTLPELLLIDKPKGITSFDVIRQLRRQYSDSHNKEKAPKMGHAGTLDPLATGLMIIGLGSGTKKLTELIKLDKQYVTEIRVGESRTTGDMEGEVVKELPISEFSVGVGEKVRAVAAGFFGTHVLPVSAYSAIKIDGVPMYVRARKAESTGSQLPEAPVREMTVHNAVVGDIEVTSEHRMIVEVTFDVSSGTYIRSLAEEFGRQLGYPACVQNLRRTRVGDFSLEMAQELEEVFK